MPFITNIVNDESTSWAWKRACACMDMVYMSVTISRYKIVIFLLSTQVWLLDSCSLYITF